MSSTHKPVIHIQSRGELGRLPDGGIINAGGVEGPYFTVDGRALIFADGTASDGSGPVIVVGGTGAAVVGHEHIQSVASSLWTIVHNKGSKRVQVTIWDSDDEQLHADVVKIVDVNTVTIAFNTAITGRAILMLF